jgi:hypothetical protein
MGRFEGCERGFDNRALQPVMGRIAAGFADANFELPGPDLVAFWNRPDEGLPEEALR